jgi:hypothetical protein
VSGLQRRWRRAALLWSPKQTPPPVIWSKTYIYNYYPH